MKDLVDIIHTHLENAGTSWSIGSFGAIGEFHQDPGEKREITLNDNGGSIVTDRGALSITLNEMTQFLPYEQLSRRKDFWLQGSNFIVPTEHAKRTSLDVLTKIGRDEEALREEDREAILYDMGLELPNVSVCIRTHDLDLQKELDKHLGRSLFEAENPAMQLIKENSPHRIFMSNIGRAEIYQHIGSTAKGIASPQGPHTHILPKLLKAKRTHAANIQIPDGTLPCLSMYPANPQLDPFGEPRAFDHTDHERFQSLFQTYGDPNIVALKAILPTLVTEGKDVDSLKLDTRQMRTAARVTLRQLAITGKADIKSLLGPWQDHLEPMSEEVDSDHHGH